MATIIRLRHAMLPLIIIILLQYSTTAKAEEFKVAGYLPEYRSYINVTAASRHLTHLILFSIEPRPDGSIDKKSCCLDDSHYSKALKAREARRKDFGDDEEPLKILVSIGGAGRSNAFPAIINDATARKRLIDDLVSLCLTKKLSGIDYDYEQPTNPSLFGSYLLLISETRAAFSPHSLLLTVALHPGQYLPRPIYTEIDAVHLMSYDLLFKKTIGHHAALGTVARVVNDFVSKGRAPREKILMGIPAYARHGANPGDVRSYSEIVDEVRKEHGRGNDDGGRLLEGLNEVKGFYFDGPTDVRRKVAWAKEQGLGGVFFWEIGQDSGIVEGGVLVSAAKEESLKGAVGGGGGGEL